ncbi:MAG: hypothetical protein Q9M26_07170 [Mariprofundales bacterium]|nr:hypothetical protein [Mariprofundales bacterium]
MNIKLGLLAAALLFSLPVSAANWGASIDDRADALSQKLHNSHDYHAYLAINLANKAAEEKDQHDTEVAKRFMQMAEQEAAKVGSAK